MSRNLQLSPAPAPPPASACDPLLDALRAGDEDAFTGLVTQLHAGLRRVARGYVSSDGVAEEVVQEAWLAVVAGVDRFEGRSSIKTWVFTIVMNIAKTRGARERRITPFSALIDEDATSSSVPPERFQALGEAWPGHWATPPRPWEDPERRLASLEARVYLRAALQALPATQQTVVTLRDVEGLEAEEVCRLMGLSEGNQRVLLHRGRTRLRAALDTYMEA